MQHRDKVQSSQWIGKGTQSKKHDSPQCYDDDYHFNGVVHLEFLPYLRREFEAITWSELWRGNL